MTYSKNEDKLMEYIEGFTQRINLENDIMTLNAAIDDWKNGRQPKAIKSLAGIGHEQTDESDKYEQKNKESL